MADVSFLKKDLKLFATLPEAEIKKLLMQAKQMAYAPQELILEAGQSVDFVGILLSGEAELIYYADDGKKYQLETISAPDLFGELNLISGAASPFNLVALSPCQALLLKDSTLAGLLRDYPDLARDFSKLIERREALYQSLALKLPNALPHPFASSPLSLKSQDEMLLILALQTQADKIDWSLYETERGGRLAWGSFAMLNSEKSYLSFNSVSCEKRIPIPEPKTELLCKLLWDNLSQHLKTEDSLLSNLKIIAHCLPSGGDLFSSPLFLSDENLRCLAADNFPHAHLNKPPLALVPHLQRLFPQAKQVAVFDTAFHHTLPLYRRKPPLSSDLPPLHYYGFHGLVHQYAAIQAAAFLKKPYQELELVVVYIEENEASVCAIDHGRSVYVSNGFSPASGLLSFQNTGPLEPELLFALLEQTNLTQAEIKDRLLKESGLKAVAGIKTGFKDLAEAAELAHQRAVMAFKLFASEVKRLIGGAAAILGGLDAVVFTGDLAYEAAGLRSLICQGLDFLGLQFDDFANHRTLPSEEVALLCPAHAKVKLLLVKLQRTLMLASTAFQFFKTQKANRVFTMQEPIPIPIEVSARHVHLSETDYKALFGPEAVLEIEKKLSQPGQFAAKQMVNLIGPKGVIERVRVLGPFRPQTQVEIAMTEQYKLGLEAPLRESGDLKASPGLTLEGPAGRIKIEEGVICPIRHIHLSTDEALRFGLKDRDIVRVRVGGDREVIFGDVVVRVGPHYRQAMHLDTDEANACHLKNGDIGYIIEIQSRP